VEEGTSRIGAGGIGDDAGIHAAAALRKDGLVVLVLDSGVDTLK
jgi:hypothetical protein